MKAIVFEREIELTKNVSESGKTITWAGELNEEEFYKLTTWKVKKNYTAGITYHADTQELYCGTGSRYGGSQQLFKMLKKSHQAFPEGIKIVHEEGDND